MDFYKILLGLTLCLQASCSNLSLKDMTTIAHRGSPGILPEHTLAGLALAYTSGPDYIEADVVLTKDEKLIVLHDIYLDTTTNVAQIFPKRARRDGRYYAVDFTLSEIQRLQIKERFNPKSKKRVFPERYPEGQTGLRVPSYKQFLTMLQHLNEEFKKDIGVYVEIKKPEFHHQEKMDITQMLVEGHQEFLKPETKTIIQCFWPDTLVRLKKDFKIETPLVQLIAENEWKESSADYETMLTTEGLNKIGSYASGVGLWLGRATPELVKKIQDKDLLVHAYTHRKRANSRKEISKLGVDGVFTDNIELLTPKSK